MVRKRLGLKFLGETRDAEGFVVGDVKLKGDNRLTEVSRIALFIVQRANPSCSTGMSGKKMAPGES